MASLNVACTIFEGIPVSVISHQMTHILP